MTYTLKTKISWSKTQTELAREFDLWGVTLWETNYPRGARLEGMNQSLNDKKVTLTYTKNGKQIVLSMDKQARAVDNLRVLYLAIESMRLNEKRGIGEILESAYLQLAAPAGERDPYEVLGLVRGVDLSVAEAVYKTMAAKYHPDIKPTGNAEKFKEINTAIGKIRKELE